MSDYLERTKNGTVFVGSDMQILRAIATAGALDLYAKTGMLPTRGVTATGMLKAANALTGHNYKRGQYAFAAAALREWANEQKQKARVD